MTIFKLVNNGIRRFYKLFKDVRKKRAELEEIRAVNPTCVIDNCVFDGVSFGKFVTILNAACLQKVTIDDFSYISNNSQLVNTHIGKFCSIGPYVQIGLGPHPTKTFVSTYPAFYSNSNSGCALNFRDDKIFDDSVPETVIGNDVWIGTNVIVPGGISIGTGAIIAAGAVVTKDVPPYALVGGNPARIIRYRFSEDEIEALLKSEWWNWPIDEIRKQVNIFSNISQFIKYIQK